MSRKLRGADPASVLVARTLCYLGVLAESEFVFCTGRKFRFDVAVVSHRIALEIEGGVWTGGRHTRGKGFLGDMEKYNLAALNGWRVFRCTPQTAMTEGVEWVLRAYAQGGPDGNKPEVQGQAPESRVHAVAEAAREHGVQDEVEDQGHGEQAKAERPRQSRGRRRRANPEPAED